MRKNTKELIEFKTSWVEMKGALKMFGNKRKERKSAVGRVGNGNKCVS